MTSPPPPSLLGGVKYTRFIPVSFNLPHKARATKLAQELQKEAETLQAPLSLKELWEQPASFETGGKKSAVLYYCPLFPTTFFFQVLFADRFRDVLGSGFKYF